MVENRASPSRPYAFVLHLDAKPSSNRNGDISGCVSAQPAVAGSIAVVDLRLPCYTNADSEHRFREAVRPANATVDLPKRGRGGKPAEPGIARTGRTRLWLTSLQEAMQKGQKGASCY